VPVPGSVVFVEGSKLADGSDRGMDADDVRGIMIEPGLLEFELGDGDAEAGKVGVSDVRPPITK
jgi:hypothetical protein